MSFRSQWGSHFTGLKKLGVDEVGLGFFCEVMKMKTIFGTTKVGDRMRVVA